MATSDYFPDTPPDQASPEMRRYLVGELERIADRVNSGIILLATLGAEPDRPEDGMIVYADGTSWNPGSGAGFYGRESGAWVKL